MDNNINFRIQIRDAFAEEIIQDSRIRYVKVSYGSRADSGMILRKVVVLVVDCSTMIRDWDGRVLNPESLQSGMRMNAMISSRMTRSDPPQSVAYTITVLKPQEEYRVTEGRVMEVDTRSRFLYTGIPGNIRSQMRFSVSRDTVITDRRGQRICLDDLRRGEAVRIEHATFQTASIPPQTAAFHISRI